MSEIALNSDHKAISDIERMLNAMNKPKISKEQEYWQGQAEKLALSENKPMVVVNMGRGNYEIWSETIAIKCGAEYCYVTGDVDSGQAS